MNKLGLELLNNITKDHIERVNEMLKHYVDLWSHFNVLIQIVASPQESFDSQYSIIYRWRLEQEHHMKDRNGGKGMNDESVKTFVDRYIPGYIFFGDIPASSSPMPPWTGRSLKLAIDENRRHVGLTVF